MRSLPLRSAVTLGVCAVTLAVVPAHAAPEKALGQITTFTATSSGSLDVVLNADGILQLRPDGTTPDVSFSGSGRMVAFSMQLISATAYDQLTAVRTLIQGRQHVDTDARGTAYPQNPSCPQPAVPSIPPVYDGCSPPTTPASHLVLHQGRYHVRMLTDGAPLIVTLHLQGPRGRARLSPTRALASSVRPMFQLDSLGGRYARAEAHLSTSTAAELIYRLDMTIPAGSHVRSATKCLYDEGQPLQTDYAPGCPGQMAGGSTAVMTDPQSVGPAATHIGGWGSLDAGAHRFGVGLFADNGVTLRAGWAGTLQIEG